MNFREIAEHRQSCRAYDSGRAVEEEKLAAVTQQVAALHDSLLANA